MIYSRIAKYTILLVFLIFLAQCSGPEINNTESLQQNDTVTPMPTATGTTSLQESDATESVVVVRPRQTNTPIPSDDVNGKDGDSKKVDEITLEGGEHKEESDQKDGETTIDLTTELTLSLSNASHSPPKDVLYEISYSGGFGGGGVTGCSGDEEKPEMVFMYPESVEWTQTINAFLCGWKDGEIVEVTIQKDSIKPIYEQSIKTDSISGLDFQYQIPPNTPYGKYTVVFKGNKSGSISKRFDLVKPTDPSLYIFDDKLILYNFSPNEHVRILAYTYLDEWKDGFSSYFHYEGDSDHILTFLAWKSYQVNNNGYLVIKLADKNQYNIAGFFVLGEVSGLIEQKSPTVSTGFRKSTVISPPYRLTVKRPTARQIENTPSLWELIDYRDLKAPGTQISSIHLPNNEIWRWNFMWCAANSALLDEILQPLTIQFFINDMEISAPQIRIYDKVSQDDWSCRIWATILLDWPENSQTKLEIRYALSKPIYDGRERFPAGTYHQIMMIDTSANN